MVLLCGKTMMKMSRAGMMCPDPNVERVRHQLYTRALEGMLKYGVTTERKDIDLLGWLQHLQEELLDAAVYIERIKQELNGG